MTETNSIGRARVALVTGATGMIGPAICQTLKRDGWRVAACATSDDSFAQYEKIWSRPVVADARFGADFDGRDTCHELVRQIEKRLDGPVALLVNNAVANPFPTSLQDLTESYCHMMLNVNLLAPLWLAQAAERSLASQQGCIVNISSVRVTKPAPGRMFYPVTKAALETLTAVLAMELGPKGVRVNAIRVGAVPGPAFMRSTLEKLPAEKARRLIAEIMPRHLAHAAKTSSTTGKPGTPENVAEVVAFLASPKAEFFNGAVLPLDGGFTLLANDKLPGQQEWDPDRAVAEWLARQGITL